MKLASRHRGTLLISLMLIGIIPSVCGSTAPMSAEQSSALQEDEIKQVVEIVCANCHNYTIASSRMASKDEWRRIVKTMVAKGADLSDDEIEPVTDYLARTFGPKE